MRDKGHGAEGEGRRKKHGERTIGEERRGGGRCVPHSLVLHSMFGGVDIELDLLRLAKQS